MPKKKVVVVGGGTGTHTVLRGLRHFASTLDIAAVVSMAGFWRLYRATT